MAIFDSCCEVNAYINQQFASRRAKWLHSMEKLSDFVLGQHILAMEQARILKVKAQYVQEGGMTILTLVSAKPCSPILTLY